MMLTQGLNKKVVQEQTCLYSQLAEKRKKLFSKKQTSFQRKGLKLATLKENSNLDICATP